MGTRGIGSSLLTPGELSSFGSFLDGLGDDNLERATKSLISSLPGDHALPEEWAGMTHDDVRALVRDTAEQQRRLRQLDAQTSTSSSANLSMDTLAALDRQHAASQQQQQQQQQQQNGRPGLNPHSSSSFGGANGSHASSFGPSSGNTSFAGTTADPRAFNLLASPPRHPHASPPLPQVYSNSVNGSNATLNLTHSPLGLSGSAPLAPSGPSMGPSRAFASWQANSQQQQQPPPANFSLPAAPPLPQAPTHTLGLLMNNMPLPAAGEGYLTNDPHVERAAAELMDLEPGPSAELPSTRSMRQPPRKRPSESALVAPPAKRSKTETSPKKGKADKKEAAKGKAKKVDTTPATAGSDDGSGSKARPALLSASQKKANHIQSEQKRRANIRRGYDALCAVVPALREDESVADRDKDKTRSEGIVLTRTLDHITTLLQQQAELQQRLVAARSIRPNAPAPRQDAPWERRWDGGKGVMVGPNGEVLDPDMDDLDGDGDEDGSDDDD